MANCDHCHRDVSQRFEITVQQEKTESEWEWEDYISYAVDLVTSGIYPVPDGRDVISWLRRGAGQTLLGNKPSPIHTTRLHRMLRRGYRETTH